MIRADALMSRKYDLLSKVKVAVAGTLADQKAVSRRYKLIIECNSHCVHLSINHHATNTRFGDRSFAVAGPRVWNSLPTQLRESDITLGQF